MAFPSRDVRPPDREGGLHPALRRYLGEIGHERASYEPSLFWQRELRVLEASGWYDRLGAAGAADLEALVGLERLGYGFSDLPAGVATPADDPELADARSRIPELQKRRKAITAQGMEVDREAWEHTVALQFLDSRGLLEEYLTLIESLRVRSSMSVARFFFYAREVAELAAEHLGAGPFNVLEIGAGAGNLAVLLHRMGLVRRWCDVDLPEMLVQAAFTVQKYVPDAGLSFNEPPAPGGPTAGRFHFVAPQHVGELPSASFDLVLNTNSFMEMDEDQRHGYLREVSRLARPGALFYNVNRLQLLPQRDGSVVESNPLLYPYDPRDRVVAWHLDPFQMSTRKGGGVEKFAITRAALAAGPPEAPGEPDRTAADRGEG